MTTKFFQLPLAFLPFFIFISSLSQSQLQGLFLHPKNILDFLTCSELGQLPPFLNNVKLTIEEKVSPFFLFHGQTKSFSRPFFS